MKINTPNILGRDRGTGTENKYLYISIICLSPSQVQRREEKEGIASRVFLPRELVKLTGIFYKTWYFMESNNQAVQRTFTRFL